MQTPKRVLRQNESCGWLIRDHCERHQSLRFWDKTSLQCSVLSMKMLKHETEPLISSNLRHRKELWPGVCVLFSLYWALKTLVQCGGTNQWHWCSVAWHWIGLVITLSAEVLSTLEHLFFCIVGSEGGKTWTVNWFPGPTQSVTTWEMASAITLSFHLVWLKVQCVEVNISPNTNCENGIKC